MEIRIYKSRRKALRMLMMTLPFVALGIFMLTQPQAPHWLGWTCIVFFGLGIPISLFQIFDRRPQIVVNAAGIFARATHRDVINWELIRDAYLHQIHGQPFIALVIDPESGPSRSHGGMYRAMAEANQALGFQEFNILLAQADIDPKALLDFIHALLQAAPEQRSSIIANTLPERS